jgi:methionyl aminopeptidase
MRAAGALVHKTLMRAREIVRPGMTTRELDQALYETYTSAGGHGVFKWYPSHRPGQGFPGNTCLSINDEVVHGIPGDRKLCEGDIISVDCGVKLGGYIGDAAVTIPVGRVAPEVLRLVKVTEETLDIAIRELRPGRRWSDIAAKMQAYVESNGFSCVREFVGHGVGTALHEDPKVPNFVSDDFLKRGDFYLQPGMTLAIEPMVIMGKSDVRLLDDGWTVVTADGTAAAHAEHSVAITPTGGDVLTDGH